MVTLNDVCPVTQGHDAPKNYRPLPNFMIKGRDKMWEEVLSSLKERATSAYCRDTGVKPIPVEAYTTKQIQT